MNILSKVVFISALLSLLSSPLLLATSEDDAYMDALSSEASKTSMKEVKQKEESAGKSTPTEEKADTDTETQSPKSSDPDKLTEIVSQQLEKLLVGREDGDLKQEDLANIVSGAVQKGHKIDSIHDAVTSAMTELRDKEGVDIKAKVLEFSIKSVNEIVGASKDIATGDVEDPYIQSLKAEAESADKEVTESDSTETASSSEASSTDKEVADSDNTEATSNSEASSTKDKESATKTTATEDDSSKETDRKTRTIIVLKGESLSKIAEKIYGSSRKFNLLYEANKDTLKDPNNIHIGQILTVPMLPKEE